MAVLEVQDFNVTYMTKHRPPFQAVIDANLVVGEQEIVGLVGESGSGKSTLGNAALRLLDPPGTITGGRALFQGNDITHLSEEELRQVRWKDVATVFQGSMNSLNPVITIEAQFLDVIKTHIGESTKAARRRAEEVLEMVSIDSQYLKFYPHELSGGMKQRVCLALSLVLNPRFVLLDEPTTGLDVVVQQSILSNLKDLQRDLGFSALMISHDLGAIMEVSDRVAVMYNGQIVDTQPAKELLEHPKHPYSVKLLDAYRELWLEPGDGEDRTAGTSATTPPPATLADPARKTNSDPVVMRVSNLGKTFTRRRGLTKSSVTAVDDVTFNLERGKITALVGQSGSGKSTIAKLIMGMEKHDEGSILFGETDVKSLRGRNLRDYRSDVQMVFQDPYSALNPAHPILYSLMRPLQNYKGMSARAARTRAIEMLEAVGLTPTERFVDKNPHQLSGGQRQRVVVARALAPDPDIVIADEPTSMLDVSIRSEILEILNRLVRDTNIAMLYITHDLLSARLLADEIMVLNRGRVVEQGNSQEVITNPQDEYTRLLLSSIPNPFTQLPVTTVVDHT
jgi:peptide/nickel transport system ATP-binding protein